MAQFRRRQILIGLGALFGGRWAWAQSSSRRHRIGFLSTARYHEAPKPEPTVSALAELGYVEGQNLVVERAYAEAVLERLPELARRLIALKLDLILTNSTQATAAVKAAGATIPVVFWFVTDPVASGFAESLARPGGNFTGIANFNALIAGKRIELLREVVPKLTRLCAWYNPDAVNDGIELNVVKLAVARLGVQLLAVEARSPGEYEKAAADAKNWNAEGVYVVASPASFNFRQQIAGLVAGRKLPAIYPNTVFVMDGGLISYGADTTKIARRAAVYVDKILRGANPAELPIEQPTQLELAINLRAAKALGLSFPQSILLRADRVIE